MGLSESELQSYLEPLTTEQSAAIRELREKLVALDATLSERIDDGKWFGGMLVYETPGGMFLYALGPRSGGFTTLHMMPYYGSKQLQEQHGISIKKLLSGKSCIRFKEASEIPPGFVESVVACGAGPLREIMESAYQRSPRKTAKK